MYYCQVSKLRGKKNIEQELWIVGREQTTDLDHAKGHNNPGQILQCRSYDVNFCVTTPAQLQHSKKQK
jgi:hypothetical protein